MKTATLLLAATVAAGCSHGHSHERRERAPAGADAQTHKDEDDAADAIVASSRAYLDAREKAPGKIAPKGLIGAQDLALETLRDAQAALQVAKRTEELADDLDGDRGRIARLKNTAALVRRAAQVAIASARETIRSGDDTALKTDAVFLRALLRSLQVETRALERSADE